MLGMKVEIFARHCIASQASAHKRRFPAFSREAHFQRFKGLIDPTVANITYVIDLAGQESMQGHYLQRESRVVPIRAGTEAGAFLQLLDLIAGLPLHPDAVIYIVEDDYLHRPGWLEVLLEAFALPIDYATLYDHRDKYTDPVYHKLSSTIFATSSCHWRTTPSTTNTFATRFSTLMEDLKIHRRYSQGVKITKDHQKFCHLQRRGRVLVSSIPGWSTHDEPEFASPCVKWI
jgi:hypothetical protein